MLVYLEFRNALTQFGEVVGDLVQTAGEEDVQEDRNQRDREHRIV